MDLRGEVLAFDPDVPLARAWTPPASWYVAPAFEAIERASVFRSSWQLACRAEEVAEPGAFVAGRTAGLPWVVVRGGDGVLRAFANACRHKATEVCAGSGVLPAERRHLVCPYHGWTYRLDGSLRTAPRIAGIEDFDREAMSLPPLGVEVWGPLVLVHADPGAAPLAAAVCGLTGALDATGWSSLRWSGRRTYEVACNWKAFCDNYLDGGYHVPHLHPGLSGQLDLDSYRTELQEAYSVQRCDARADRTEGGAIYAFCYPNLMINRYGPCLDTNLVLPVAPDRCRVVFDFWFAEERAGDEAWVRASVADSERTQLEDMAVSERVQAGLASGTFRAGRYAPRVEAAVHHFHRRLAADLRRAIAAERTSDG
jgi:choline monooxygenase